MSTSTSLPVVFLKWPAWQLTRFGHSMIEYVNRNKWKLPAWSHCNFPKQPSTQQSKHFLFAKNPSYGFLSFIHGSYTVCFISTSLYRVNTRHWVYDEIMLGRHRRWWPSIKPEWDQCLVFHVIYRCLHLTWGTSFGVLGHWRNHIKEPTQL